MAPMNNPKRLFLQTLLLLPILAGCRTTSEPTEPSPTSQPAPSAEVTETPTTTTFSATPAPFPHPAVSPDGAWIATPTYDGSGVGLANTASQEALTWTAQEEVAAVSWADLSVVSAQPDPPS
jgi:hypothetical protein